MKRIKTYKEHVNELVSFTNRGEDPSGKDNVIWSNGVITVNPSQEDRLEAMNKIGNFGLYLRADRNKKQVTISPMDDWANTKAVLNMQKALKDMIKANYIDDSWTCLVMNNPKLTKRSIGSTKVKDIVKFDYSFDKVIPFAFHGTSDYYLDEIKRKGILPRDLSYSEENWDKGYTEESGENVYLTTDYERAKYYADYAVDALKKEGIKSKPVVILIENLPTSKVIMDDDLITNMGMLQLLSLLNSGKTKEQFAQEASYITGIRNSGQFAWKGRIPASMITKIFQSRQL